MKLKTFALLACIVIANKTFAQSQTLYNQQGLRLNYTATLFNTVSIEAVNFYDQYEINVFFSNQTGKPIFYPNVSIDWDKDVALQKVSKNFWVKGGDGFKEYKYKYMKDSLPQSQNQIRFGFPDGNHILYWQPYPNTGSQMFPKAPRAEHLMLPGQTDSCKIYFLVEHDTALPQPKWNVDELVFKEKFKKENLAPMGFNQCGCTDKNKPRGKKGDKPKNMPKANLVSQNTNKPTILGHTVLATPKPTLRSVEELKNLILKNLRENTKSITWTSKYSQVGEQRQGNYKFDIIDGYLIVELEETELTEIHMNEDKTLLKKLKIRFKLKSLYVGKMDDILKRTDANPSCINLEGSGEINLLNYQELTRITNGTLSEGYYPSKLSTWHGNIWGYNRGEGDKNYNELNKAYRELIKQL